VSKPDGYNLTYDEAMAVGKTGKPIRRKGYSPGWTLQWHPPHEVFYCINPHTGSNYLFTAKDEDRCGKWKVAK
jgi:hypothetical protein